jgi:cytoskeletal protein CcmA (bactofilin family)
MYKILFIIIALFLIMLAVSKCKFTESFANTPVAITSDNVADYIYTVYKADVKAIQNLADIAMKLQAGGIIVPGSMTIQNTLNVSGDSNLGGKLEVKGDAILAGKLEVKGATTIDTTLEVKGATTLDTTLDVKGATTLDTTLDVKGATTIEGNLIVKGSIMLTTGMHYFKQQMDLSGPLWANQDDQPDRSTVKNPDGGTYKGTDWILSISGFTFWNDDGGNIGPNRLTPYIYKDGLWHVQCACYNHWPRHLVVSIVATPVTMFSHNWGPYDLNALNYPGYPNG